jgi:hypothetical protein
MTMMYIAEGDGENLVFCAKNLEHAREKLKKAKKDHYKIVLEADEDTELYLVDDEGPRHIALDESAKDGNYTPSPELIDMTVISGKGNKNGA